MSDRNVRFPVFKTESQIPSEIIQQSQNKPTYSRSSWRLIVKDYHHFQRAIWCKVRPAPAGGLARKEGAEDETDRFRQSVSRAKSAVFQLACCNSWDWFGTFTLSEAKADRFDLDDFRKRFSQFIRNEKRRGIDISYVLVPEQHKNGAWHMHGLLSGIPPAELSKFDSCAPLRLRRGGFLNWRRYADRFGFCSFGAVKDPAACATYLSKYVTKNLDESHVSCGKHLYFASQGLQKAATIFEQSESDIWHFVPTFQNDFVCYLDSRKDEPAEF